jgi:glycosyltransferase involved in cell wall biosynthesis
MAQSLKGIATLLGSGPAGWMRVLGSFFEAKKQAKPSRLAGLALMGANLAALAKKEGWTHLHAHSCADSAFVAMFASRISKLPYSVTLHGPLEDYGPGQTTKWKHAQFGIIITKKLLGEARETLGDALPDVVEIAPMGVDLANFKRNSPYQPWDGNGPAKIVSCGRLNRIKGHQELIEAVGLLRDLGREVELTICGEDEQGGDGFRKELEKQINEARLNDAVHLLGAVSEERVRQAMEEAHIFALASHHEPLGVAIMEGMAMGLPVVSTDAGGVPELIDSGEDGILVDPKRPDLLAEAIRSLLDDPQRSRDMGQAARAKVERSFHAGVSADCIARQLGLEVWTGPSVASAPQVAGAA